MRSSRFAFTAGFVLLGTLGGSARPAEEGVDLTCAWRSFGRRCVVRGSTYSLRARGTLNVLCDGSPGPKSIAVALYTSSDGVVAPGASPVASKRVRPRPGRTVRVTFDAPIAFGTRFVVARVDDADESSERDETNNFSVTGPLSSGEEFAPLEPGNQWRYAGVQKVGRDSPVAFTDAVVDEGDHAVGDGSVAQAVSSSNSSNAGRAIVEYLQRDQLGVVDWGNDDSTDWITSQIVPFRAFLFPFASAYDFVSVVRHRLPGLGDVDGDGRAERVDAVQRVRFFRLEDVDVPVGRFSGCAHVRTTATATITLSRSGYRFRVVGTQHQWLAPGIGPVRKVEDYSGPGVRQHVEETLTGAATTTAGCGVVDGLTFASISAPAGDAFAAAPAAASDGTTTLLATVRDAAAGEPHGLIGVFVVANGRSVREAQIADLPVEGFDPPTPAAAYGAGVFAVAYRRGGEPLHVKALAADGSPAWGSTAVDVPVFCGTEGACRVVFDGAEFVVFAAGVDQATSARIAAVARVSSDGALLETVQLGSDPSPTGGVAASWDGASTLCVWSADTELRAKRIDASGSVLDAVPIGFARAPGIKSHPAVAASPAGGWLVAWTQSQSGGPTRVRRCLVSADGTATPADGIETASSSYDDSRPEIALDGAEFLVASLSQSLPAVHLVRLTLDGVEVAEPQGGFGPTFVTPAWGETLQSPIVVGLRDRALVAWQRTSSTYGVSPTLVGAAVFPRRADLRPAVR